MHLNTARLRAQQHVRLAAHGSFVTRAVHDVKRVLHAAAGMVGRCIERREVVIIGFDLGPFGHRVAKAQEHVADFLGHAIDQMARAQLLHAARQRDVDRRRIDAGFQLGCSQRLLALLKRFFHDLAGFVHCFAHFSALLFRDLAHVAQVAGQRARLAHDRHAHRIERRRVDRRRDFRKRLFAQSRQFVCNRHI